VVIFTIVATSIIHLLLSLAVYTTNGTRWLKISFGVVLAFMIVAAYLTVQWNMQKIKLSQRYEIYEVTIFCAIFWELFIVDIVLVPLVFAILGRFSTKALTRLSSLRV